MLPKYHALAAAVAVVPLVRRGWSTLALAGFLSGAVLVDVDHYLGYVWATGDFSLRRAYQHHRSRYHRPRRWRLRPHPPHLGFQYGRAFHALPFIALVFLASWPLPWLRPAAWGLLYHRLQDELWGYVV